MTHPHDEAVNHGTAGARPTWMWCCLVWIQRSLTLHGEWNKGGEGSRRWGRDWPGGHWWWPRVGTSGQKWMNWRGEVRARPPPGWGEWEEMQQGAQVVGVGDEGEEVCAGGSFRSRPRKLDLGLVSLSLRWWLDFQPGWLDRHRVMWFWCVRERLL